MEGAARERRAWRSYSVYGLTLRTDVSLVTPLMPSEGAPDVTFTRVGARPPEAEAGELRPLRHSRARLPGGEPWLSLCRSDRFDLIRVAEVVDFYLFSDRIVAHLRDPEYAELVETYLLGGVLAFWCERSGTPMLHASAVVARGRAVAFMATNEGGKSSLAAALMEDGCPLLTDDLLRVRRESGGYRVEPGYPQMRFWPHDAERLLGRHEPLELAHPGYAKLRVPVGSAGFGTFRGRAAPLGCLYIPRRIGAAGRVAPIEFVDVPPRQAILELIRGSFVPRWVEAAGYTADQFRLFADLAARVPLRTVAYPDGVEHLPEVRAAILRDLSREFGDRLPGERR